MTSPGFVRIDPGGVVGLATRTEGSMDQLAAIGRRLGTVLDRLGAKSAVADDRIQAIAAEMAELAAGLRWRARVIEAQVDVVAGLLVEYALFARFRVSPTPAQIESWHTPFDPEELAVVPPAGVAAVFAETAPVIAAELARRHPDVVGSLDGAPVRLRYAANRILIERHVAELERMLDRLEEPEPADWLPPWLLRLPIRWHPERELRAAVAGRIRDQIARYRTWIREDRQILLFDPTGDGRVAEVFGDLEDATHVTVVVPGMANDLDGFEGGLRDRAARLFAASSRISPTATIAWLGYDTPDGADAALQGAAQDGAPALRRLIDGLDPAGVRHLTVVAHSYGSVLAGIAAGGSLGVDDLVVLGSPGTTLAGAAAARLRPGGRVWAALANADPIAAGINPSELPPWWLPGALGPMWFAADMSNGAEALWHGANPASPDFGALRFSTDGAIGHSEYFEGESLDNLALIATGRYSEVELVD